MLIGEISFNEKAFNDWSFDQFKEYYEKAGYKSTGLTAEQLAKKIGIEKKKAEEEASK